MGAMQLSIIPYQPKYQPYFDRYNRAWIVKYFRVEPIDELVLSDPETHIITKGGEVWFAEIDGAILGTYALLARDDGNFEFSKLGVAPEAKGKRLGQRLLHHAYQRAKTRGAQKLIIYTNSSLINACKLYRDEGFIDMQVCESEKARYARCDLLIERGLDDIEKST
jgi:GNAT superfamily N-acetyltransferase